MGASGSRGNFTWEHQVGRGNYNWKLCVEGTIQGSIRYTGEHFKKVGGAILKEHQVGRRTYWGVSGRWKK